MSEKINYDNFVITSIEEEDYIKKDFRKAVAIISLAIVSSLLVTYILYLV